MFSTIMAAVASVYEGKELEKRAKAIEDAYYEGYLRQQEYHQAAALALQKMPKRDRQPLNSLAPRPRASICPCCHSRDFKQHHNVLICTYCRTPMEDV